MEFKATFFMIVAVGLIATAAGIIINDWGIEYGSGITSDLGSYEKVGELADYVENYQNGSISPQSGEASTDPETLTYRGVWGIITGIFKPFRLIYDMMDAAFETFSIPDYIKYGITTMIIAAIVFTIIAIVFRMTRQSA